MKNAILFTQDKTPLAFYRFPYKEFSDVIIAKWTKNVRIRYAEMKNVKFGFVITKINQNKL